MHKGSTYVSLPITHLPLQAVFAKQAIWFPWQHGELYSDQKV